MHYQLEYSHFKSNTSTTLPTFHKNGRQFDHYWNRGWDLKGLGHTHDPGDARLVTRQKWWFFEIFVGVWINDQEAFWEDVSWDKNASHELTDWGRTICTRVCTTSSSTAILSQTLPPLSQHFTKMGGNSIIIEIGGEIWKGSGTLMTRGGYGWSPDKNDDFYKFLYSITQMTRKHFQKMFLETKMRVMNWLIGVEPFAREYALPARVQPF